MHNNCSRANGNITVSIRVQHNFSIISIFSKCPRQHIYILYRQRALATSYLPFACRHVLSGNVDFIDEADGFDMKKTWK